MVVDPELISKGNYEIKVSIRQKQRSNEKLRNRKDELFSGNGSSSLYSYSNPESSEA